MATSRHQDYPTEIPEELMGEHPPIDMFDDDTPICSPDCTCEACACSLENPEACEACQQVAIITMI